ncbi:hypothetical protein Tco_0641501 [Tanacetum coccineum]
MNLLLKSGDSVFKLTTLNLQIRFVGLLEDHFCFLLLGFVYGDLVGETVDVLGISVTVVLTNRGLGSSDLASSGTSSVTSVLHTVPLGTLFDMKENMSASFLALLGWSSSNIKSKSAQLLQRPYNPNCEEECFGSQIIDYIWLSLLQGNPEVASWNLYLLIDWNKLNIQQVLLLLLILFLGSDVKFLQFKRNI